MAEFAFEFSNRSFCFTGKLRDLKRSAAQREVRARGGFTLDRINERLDFLVVGDEPSAAWKFGNYGRKIEEARKCRSAGSKKPLLLSEAMFTEGLVCCPTTNSGAVDEKVVVCNYKFLVSKGASVDEDSLSRAVEEVEARFQCHVSASASWASVRRDLFGDDADAISGTDILVVEYRFIRHQSLDDPVTSFLEAVNRAFEGVPGVDGTLRWFERAEGSADFVRLLKEVPSCLRFPAH